MQYAKNAADALMPSLEDWLRSLEDKHGLSPAAHSVVQAVINDPRFASFASASELANAANVNVATITRAAQSLNFSGWPDFRQEIRARFMSKLSASDLNVVHQQETGNERPFDTAINRQIEQLVALRRRTDRQALRDVAKAIAAGRRRVIIGSGSFAAIEASLRPTALRFPMRLAT